MFAAPLGLTSVSPFYSDRPNKVFGRHSPSQNTYFNRKVLSRHFCFFWCQKKEARPARTSESVLPHRRKGSYLFLDKKVTKNQGLHPFLVRSIRMPLAVIRGLPSTQTYPHCLFPLAVSKRLKLQAFKCPIRRNAARPEAYLGKVS